jgi:hypothetical protein
MRASFSPGANPNRVAQALIARIAEWLARHAPGWKSSWRNFRNLDLIRLQEAAGGLVDVGNGNLITNLHLPRA